MKVGIFGGTFDPVHNGHRALVEGVISALPLDRLLLFPARQNPLKMERPQASDEDRIEMLRLCFEDMPAVAIDARELRRTGPSFTIDTVRELASELTDAEFSLIMGADSLERFSEWKDVNVLCQLCTPIFVTRKGFKSTMPTQLVAKLGRELSGRNLCALTLPEISSTAIRRSVSQSDDISALVPAAVASYIHAKGLYRLCST